MVNLEQISKWFNNPAQYSHWLEYHFCFLDQPFNPPRYRKVLRAFCQKVYEKPLASSRKSHVSFFLYILSSFYFIRCTQNDFFRAFYCKTFLLFYYFFWKKNKKSKEKKTPYHLLPVIQMRMYIYTHIIFKSDWVVLIYRLMQNKWLEHT